MPETSTVVAALVGGGLIGLAATLMLALNGRILGVSGIAAGIVLPGGGDRLARTLFIAGMLCGAFVVGLVSPGALPGALTGNQLLLAVAGLAVGFGTRLGSGCTSGHGVCGMARLSTRSFVATGIFMATAMVTVFVTRHVLGVAP